MEKTAGFMHTSHVQFCFSAIYHMSMRQMYDIYTVKRNCNLSHTGQFELHLLKGHSLTVFFSDKATGCH